MPYRTGSIVAVMTGEIDYCFESIPSALPYIQSGKVVALAVTAPTRVAVLKDVPTIAESGYPSYQVLAWSALFAPAGTPEAAIWRINEAANRALRDEGLKLKLAQTGSTTLGGSPQQLETRVAEEIARWPVLVKEAGVTVD